MKTLKLYILIYLLEQHFKVKTGNAPSPVFSHGLPAINASNPFKDKTSIQKRTTNTTDANSRRSKNTDKINSSLKNTICECNPYKTFHWKG